MKRYIIIKIQKWGVYAITTKEALQDYKKTGFLPYDDGTKKKKDLIKRALKRKKYINNLVISKTYFV